MTDDQISLAYRAMVAARRPESRNDCADPEALLALVERTGPEADRLATLDHVMACGRCLDEFELLRAVHSGAEADARPAQWRWWVGPLAAAAIVMLAVGGIVWSRAGRANAPEIERGVSVPPVTIAPRGDTPRPSGSIRFTWLSVSGATQYDLHLLAPDRTTIYRVTTGDTLAVLPDSVAPVPGREYSWTVAAHVPDGPTLSSSATRFTLR